MTRHCCVLHPTALVVAVAIAAVVNSGVSADESFSLDLDADDTQLFTFDPIALRCTLTNEAQEAQEIPAWVSLSRGLVVRVKRDRVDKWHTVVPFVHVSHGANKREAPRYALPAGGKQTGIVLALWAIADTPDRNGNERAYLFSEPGRYRVVAELHGAERKLQSSPLTVDVRESSEVNRAIAAIAKRSLGNSLPPFRRAQAAPLDELIAVRDHLSASKLRDLLSASIAWRKYDENRDDLQHSRYQRELDDVLATMSPHLRQLLIAEVAQNQLSRGQLGAAESSIKKLDKALFERWYLEVAIGKRRKESRDVGSTP